jgi:hypothetical protein
MRLTGGLQSYTAEKAKYLEKNGWSVSIIFNGKSTGTCIFSSLNKYVGGAIPELGTQPSKYLSVTRKLIVNKMVRCLELGDQPVEKIIVESHADIFALWGEVLAERIGAKHLCFICNERFREATQLYEKYIDFFDFKHKRKELACTSGNRSSGDLVVKLFDGYKQIPPEERYVLVPASAEPVQDVHNDTVESIQKREWNICYLGRTEKLYVPSIIDGICRFAQKYKNKDIQFIIAGNADGIENLLKDRLSHLNNVLIVRLGDLVPIPRELFGKLDVIIAGAGCAFCAVREGVPTIVADAGNYRANGLLGYETMDTLCQHDAARQTTFDEALERVLVMRVHENMQLTLPEVLQPEFYYNQHFIFMEQSENNLAYYRWDKGTID